MWLLCPLYPMTWPGGMARLLPPVPLPGKRQFGRSRAGNHTHAGPPDERHDPAAARATATPRRDAGRYRGELEESRGIFPVCVRAARLAGWPWRRLRTPREVLVADD